MLSTIYEVPLLMQKEGLDMVVLRKLGLKDKTDVNLDQWCNFLRSFTKS